ncbi:MAG: beta strand repeat-containing protein [Blastomonas sp.]
MAYNRTTIARRMMLAKATSAMALATGLVLGTSGPVHAQAFEGNPTVISGGVNIVRSPGTDDIQVDTNQAVINWTTNDTAVTGGPINFLPTGRTAFFRNNPSAQNFFTVLNRIIPTGTGRAIQFNGTIISQLQTALGVVPGGNVWFYSPGGIVVNSTAAINVGGLLLTSSDPLRDGSGNFITPGGSFTLGPSASASSVIIQPGATILATPENSYVAMVAPTVLQAGSVNVNGSALYVGAEAATITFGGNGLFDIQVTTGTNGTGGIAVGHGGVTTGPASSGTGDNHRIYMVAVPKNNAITMAIGSGSRLGFDIAGAANVVGNSIILSAGYDVFGDFVDTGSPVNPAQAADIVVSPADITSSFIGAASRNFLAQSLGGDINFFSDVQAFGAGSAIFDANGASASINVGGNLVLSADSSPNIEGADAVGGTVRLRAVNGGVISLLGNADLGATATGGSNDTAGTVGSGTGGLIEILANDGGLIAIAGNLRADASGFAGQTETSGVGSNFGRGGNIGVYTLGSGGSLLVGGTTDLFALGVGSQDGGSASGTGGAGFGGRIDVFAQGSGHLMRFGDAFLAEVTGFGATGANAGNGGIGQGGQIFVSTEGASTLDFLSDLSLLAFGFGGTAGATAGASGGAATGGTASLSMGGNGGLINVAADAILRASANGGVGEHSGNLGGNAQGGGAIIFQNAAGGNLTISGTTQVESFGIGGMATFGGNGTGGNAQVIVQNAGQLNLLNGLIVDSSGLGGTASTPGTGSSGNGTGGAIAQLIALTGGVVNITGDVTVSANGAVFGSALTGIDGGNGTGGNASISQNTLGQITINGSANVTATGTGDANQGGGDGIAGNGVGGDARIVVNDFNVTITGNAVVDASGFGGNNLGGIRGGNGIGGLANLGAAVGTLSIGGAGIAKASGLGGDSFSPGSGGDGTGGQALVGTVTSTARIQIGGLVDATANGEGGDGSGVSFSGGVGTGGGAQIFAQNGTVNVTGTSFLSASAFGGNGNNNAAGGAAQGGNASFVSLGNGQITLNNDAFLAVFAGAGSSLNGSVGGSGNTGTATGGNAVMLAQAAGSGITVNGSFFADATAFGGSSGTGIIGLATGGLASANAQSGLLQILGDLTLDASASGGAPTITGTGGAATGGRTQMVVFGTGGGTTSATGALVQLANGFGGSAAIGTGGTGTGGLAEFGTLNVIGTVTVGSNASLFTDGFGGSALSAGSGGNGVGGQSRAGVNGATLRGANITLSATGAGGDGASGGNGGNGTGGTASLIAGSGPVTGLVDFDNVFINVSGFGGSGGAGTNGSTGGNGGIGGIGTGGEILLLGTAGNGQLDVLDVQLSADGVGGFGGAGGIGSSGAGGNGGAGGAGRGGFITFGTQSGTAALGVNVGFADIANVTSAAGGFGGTGGNGGSGFTIAGNGGNGGAGIGGDNVLIVRGSRVTADDITMLVAGIGGAGGIGAIGGNGGDGAGGGLGFAITDRFQIPANRGLLQAGNITGLSTGIGGAGVVGGLGYYSTGNGVELRNADASVASFVINVGGNLPDPTTPIEDSIRISDGTFSSGNSFTYATPNSLSVVVSNASLNASAVGLSAGTFVDDTVITAPTSIGAINADAIGLFSNGDMRITANLNAVQDIAISVPGLVDLFDISSGGVISISGGILDLGNLSSGNHINLFGGSIATGAISAANFVEMFGSGGIFTSDIDAGSYIFALSDGGDISTGNLTAGGFIDIETLAGNISVGDLTAGEDVYLDAIGSINFGNASTGLNFEAIADGNITGGNITAQSALAEADYGVGLAATGNIQVGSIQSARNIGALSTGSFTSGGLSTSENVILLVDGNIAINGAITTGTGANRFFYIGNSSMSSLLDGGGGNDNTSFIGGDPSPVFAVAPVRTLGSLTVNGPIQTGNFVVGLGTGFAVTGPITATNGRIAITASSIAAQNLVSTFNTSLNATSGNLVVGSVTAGGAVGLLAGAGQITSGVLTGTSVGVDGQGAVSIGGVTSTGAAQLRSIAGTFSSLGAITGGTVNIGGTALVLANVTSTAGGIAMAATAGNLSFGTLTSSANTQFNVSGSVTGGAITAGSWIGTIVGGNMTLGNLRTTGPGTSANGFSIGLGAQGNIVTGTIGSFGLLGIGSDDGQGNLGNAASITTGAITAGGSAFLRSTQGLTTGAITSTNEIRVRGGTVTTGALQATNAILAAAMTGSLNTGNITTGTSAVLLAAQSVNTGGISTGTTGTTLIANSSAISPTGLISTIDLNALLAATPVRVGGSVSIGAPVSTGTLLSASTGGFSASSAITAGTRISLDVGGTAVFGGLAAAPTIAISSADIAFSQGGGLGNASTGTLTLTANRSGPVILGGSGDSQSQQGSYTLDGSEISRIRAQNIVINAPNVSSSSSTGIEIRALTMNGSGASSGVNLNGSEGSLTINTGGTIRVNGNAVFNSMAATNRVALNAGRVEINADTGGIFLNGSSPGGILSITANNIHIAGAELLGRLAENVNFTGRDTALGLPIATSRPDGVIQASRLQFNVGSTLLIQNTGTSLLNAGFFGRVGSIEILPRSSQSSSSGIDMVIYGQLLDTGDIVRNGSSVRDLIFPRSTSAGQDSSGPSGFTANSSVNGCLLNAISCGSGGVTQESPTVVTHAGPPPPRPSEERQAEREKEEAKAAAEEAARGDAAPRRPIMPPVSIVNTRNLGVEPIIAEPVTSGGNPNLQLDQPLPTPLPDTGGQP